MVQFGEYYAVCLLKIILMAFQAGVTSKWINDSQRFLLEHFDTIHSSPSQIYYSALPLSPPSWLHKCYSAELPPIVKVVKGLPAEWGACSRKTVLGSWMYTLSYHDGKVAVGSGHSAIIILDTITGSQTAVLSGHTDQVRCVIFSLDGISLVSGSFDKTVKLWDVQTGGIVKTFSGHTQWVFSVSISVDHTTVASGSSDNTCRLWDIKSGGCRHIIKQQDVVGHVMFSPTDPQHLISISNEKIWQWDANGHWIKPPFHGRHASFSPDGAQFVSCHGNTITVHNSSFGTTVSQFQITGSDDARWCSFSPEGGLVAVAAGETAYCWDITGSKPQLVETFIGHTDKITGLVFSSPTTLISVSGDKSVWFWQIGAQSTDSTVIDPKCTPLPPAPIESITLQAKDDIVITYDSDGVVKTWDTSTGTHKTSFQTPANDNRGDVRLINERLILVYHDYTEKKDYVWDVENEKPLLEVSIEVSEFAYQPKDLRISGDGSKIFHLYNSSIQAWSIQTGGFVAKAIIGFSDRLRSFMVEGSESLTVEGSKVWAHRPLLECEGWDFGISGSNPAKLSGLPTLSNGSILWDPREGKIKNAGTGGTIFQLSGRFANPVDVQCDGSYLVAGYESGEILILELRLVLL